MRKAALPARTLVAALRRWALPDLHFLRRRVARRLFVLFVAAALLPIMMSGWLAHELVGDASARLDRQSLVDTTEQVGQQVFERLLNAKAVLRSWPDEPQAGKAMPGLGRMFSAAELYGRDGRRQWSSLKGKAEAIASLPAANHPVELRIFEDDGVIASVVLVSVLPEGQAWVATLSDAYLWAPLRDAGAVPNWRVFTLAGRDLATFGPSLPDRNLAVASKARIEDQAWQRLFLRAEFAGEDWILAQRRELNLPTWQGIRLEAWLALMTLAALCSAAWLSLAQIRRILVPLDELTAGTHQLAAGDMSIRVPSRGNDEFDLLAQAFNNMAARIHSREQELNERASRDSLTGLMNRHGLRLELQRLLADRSGSTLGVFYIDLDNFKQVNDAQGHEAGDRLLRSAAVRLVEIMPSHSLIARLGGDEFVVVLGLEGPQQIAEHALACCSGLAEPFALNGVLHYLGASVGVALAPEHGCDEDTLLRHADLAMYSAKRREGKGYAVFEPAMDHRALERMRINAELRQALKHDQFVLHFQPRVSTLDGKINSAEALIRWQHPTRGLLMPGHFIDVAEESDFIESLGDWVLDAACLQYARWRGEGVALGRLSVNVSARQLASGRLPQVVARTLARHRVAPQALELEVTESLLVGNIQRSAEQLGEIRRTGVTIALDDFGTGYSSMASLRQLPIDVIKIDRSFVADLGQDESALAVVRAILSMADSLRLQTVAEGIETPLQAAILRELRCDEFQGYLFHKPLSAGAFGQLRDVDRVGLTMAAGLPAHTA